MGGSARTYATIDREACLFEIAHVSERHVIFGLFEMNSYERPM